MKEAFNLRFLELEKKNECPRSIIESPAWFLSY